MSHNYYKIIVKKQLGSISEVGSVRFFENFQKKSQNVPIRDLAISEI